jgi:hypothetical protein
MQVTYHSFCDAETATGKGKSLFTQDCVDTRKAFDFDVVDSSQGCDGCKNIKLNLNDIYDIIYKNFKIKISKKDKRKILFYLIKNGSCCDGNLK